MPQATLLFREKSAFVIVSVCRLSLPLSTETNVVDHEFPPGISFGFQTLLLIGKLPSDATASHTFQARQPL